MALLDEPLESTSGGRSGNCGVPDLNSLFKGSS